MSLTSTRNRCPNNGPFPVKLLNILSIFLFLVISIRKWIELYYLINRWRSNFKMWANGWRAAAAENNLNSEGQTEAGFQRTFETSPDCCSRINPYHRGRRGLSGALLPVTHLGSWRSTCLREERWEQGWDYPSAPPCTLPESNLKLSSCTQLFFCQMAPLHPPSAAAAELNSIQTVKMTPNPNIVLQDSGWPLVPGDKRTCCTFLHMMYSYFIYSYRCDEFHAPSLKIWWKEDGQPSLLTLLETVLL